MLFKRYWRFVERYIQVSYQNALVRSIVHLFYGVKQPEKWLFVIGCYNSGTTLLQRLIAAHPDVSTLPREGVRYTSELTQPEDYGWTRMWVECEDKIRLPPIKDPEKAERIMRDWAPFLQAEARVFLEKSISNVPRMEWFEKNFPNAYFIGIVRNPYAVSEGIQRKGRPRGNASARFGSRYPIEFPARQWLAANTALRDGEEKVRRFLLTHYENFVVDPVECLGDIFTFVGLSKPHMEFKHGVLTVHDYSEMICNMNTNNIARLSQDDIRAISRVLGATNVEAFGYDVL